LVMRTSDDVPSNLNSIFVLQPLKPLVMRTSYDVPSNLNSIFVLQPLKTFVMSADTIQIRGNIIRCAHNQSVQWL
jgi:hypothetical protein